MKIAVTTENNFGLDSTIAGHFGHALFFILVEVKDGNVISTNGISNPYAESHQPGQIPEFVHRQNADVILSGGMGGRAINFFAQYGIQAATGAVGSVRQALENYLGGKLTEAAPCSESVEHGHG